MPDERPRPLDGLRCAEFGFGRASALVGMVLADFGADVVTVREPPDVAHAHGMSRPLAAVQWDRGKTTVQLDLRLPEDALRATELVTSCDVVVDGLGPGVLDRFGLGYQRVSAVQPQVVYAVIRGSRPGEPDGWARDASVLARTGRMLEMGRHLGLDRPAFVPVGLPSFAASQAALQAVLGALHERESSGLGQLVETDLVRAMSPFDVGTWLAEQKPAVVRDIAGATARGSHTPYMGYLTARASDGTWLQFANWSPHLFWNEITALGLDALRDEPRFAALPFEADEEGYEALWEQVLLAVAAQPAGHWVETALARGTFGVDRFLPGGAGFDHPQVRHNGDVVERDDDEFGPVTELGPLAHLAITPAVPGAGPVPRGLSGPAVRRREIVGRASRGALDGVTVLELATMFAGPFGPSVLAEMGARVIKVEPPGGDPMRQNPILSVRTQQGKESVCLDLKQPSARAVLRRIAGMADVLVESYRPGAAARLGVDYATLRAENPLLVYVHAAGYGVDGPYAHLPMYHPIPGAVCGAAHIQAAADSLPAPAASDDLDALKSVSYRLAFANEGHPDSVAALVVATAALLGLAARDRHGVGQEIRTSMLCSNAYLMSEQWIRVGDACGHVPSPDPELLGRGALQRLYAAADGWLFVDVLNDDEWSSLCKALGLDALGADPALATADGRTQHNEQVEAVLSAALASRTADEWEDLLFAAGVSAVRADRGTYPSFLASDPRLREEQVVVDTVHPDLGPHWRHGALAVMSRSVATLGPGTRVGSATRRVLAEVGYSPEEVEAMVLEGSAIADG